MNVDDIVSEITIIILRAYMAIAVTGFAVLLAWTVLQ